MFYETITWSPALSTSQTITTTPTTTVTTSVQTTVVMTTASVVNKTPPLSTIVVSATASNTTVSIQLPLTVPPSVFKYGNLKFYGGDVITTRLMQGDTKTLTSTGDLTGALV